MTCRSSRSVPAAGRKRVFSRCMLAAKGGGPGVRWPTGRTRPLGYSARPATGPRQGHGPCHPIGTGTVSVESVRQTAGQAYSRPGQLAGATEADVVVRVGRLVVAIDRERTGVGTVVEVAAAQQRTGLAQAPIPRAPPFRPAGEDRCTSRAPPWGCRTWKSVPARTRPRDRAPRRAARARTRRHLRRSSGRIHRW